MGNAHAHLNKNNKSFQTEGSRIMQLADILRPYVSEWLKSYKNQDGLPVQPATVRGVALNMAQSIVKQSI